MPPNGERACYVLGFVPLPFGLSMSHIFCWTPALYQGMALQVAEKGWFFIFRSSLRPIIGRFWIMRRNFRARFGPPVPAFTAARDTSS
jgi:hypothetical protein